mgnify:CR=1 FL=1
MRIDKYLKLSRLIKRRSMAKEFIKNKRAFINGKVAKVASFVSVGDILVLKFGRNILTVKIISTPEIVKKNDSRDLYKVLSSKNRE